MRVLLINAKSVILYYVSCLKSAESLKDLLSVLDHLLYEASLKSKVYCLLVLQEFKLCSAVLKSSNQLSDQTSSITFQWAFQEIYSHLNF